VTGKQGTTATDGTRIAVVIATLGRPAEVGQLLGRLDRQSHRPSAVVLSVTGDADLPPGLPGHVRVVIGGKGLPAQRNRGMDLVRGECDVIAFLDDDYLPSDHALAGMAALFARHPDVAGANGRLLADGINSRGIDLEEAEALIAAHDRLPQSPAPRILKDMFGLYGCNMAYRSAAIGDARFDERLALYGWQEDIDFAAQLLPRGRLVRTDAFAGVHRGVKGARTSGAKLGYSQVVNPLYLSRKGTMQPRYAARLVLNNVLANHLKALRPEPWVDRRGRVRGNWRGMWHVLTGRDDPRHILDMH
jgi:GT2 family glycosyltransferase